MGHSLKYQCERSEIGAGIGNHKPASEHLCVPSPGLDQVGGGQTWVSQSGRGGKVSTPRKFSKKPRSQEEAYMSLVRTVVSRCKQEARKERG